MQLALCNSPGEAAQMSVSRTMAKSTVVYLHNGTPAQTDNGLSITTHHNMDVLTDIMLPEA